MRVSDLYESSPLRGQDVYILGLGASLSAFPPGFFEGRVCVLLKDAWRLLPKVGPVAFSTASVYLEDCRLPIQIVKARHKGVRNPERDDNHVRWDNSKYYCFSYREPPWDRVSHNDPATLWKEPNHYFCYPKSSLALFAIQFAVLCGAKAVFLAGCDCGELAGREYLDPVVAKWRTEGKIALNRGKGLDLKKLPAPKRNRHNYQAYSEGLLYLMKRAWDDKRVPVVTLTPFAGLFGYEEQFARVRAGYSEK